MIRNKITRTVAGVICCILVGIFMSSMANVLVNNYRQQKQNVPYYEISDEMNSVYYKLWAVGNMWLRNLDSDGNFNGTKELENQTVKALQELGCMDSKGNIVLNSDYDFYVNYGNNSFSNTDKKYEDFNSDYSIMRRNDNINHPYISDYIYTVNDFNMYDTNYGMHYYYLNGKGIALFDYDVSELDSYIDELGATIYYKTDGSTPLPDEYYNYSYGYSYNGSEYTQEYYDNDGNLILNEEISEDEYDDNVSRETHQEYDNGVYVYLHDRFIKVKQDNFKTVQLSENNLTIAIQPDNDVISTIEEYHNIENENNKKAVRYFMNNIPLVIVAFVLLLFVLITGGYSVKEKKFVMSVPDKILAEIPIAVIILAFCAVVFIFDYNFYDFYSLIYDSYSEHMFYILCSIAYALICGAFVFSLNSLIVRIKCRSFWKTTFIYVFLIMLWGWIKKLRNVVSENFINRDMMRDDKFTRRFFARTVVFAVTEMCCIFLCIDWETPLLLFFVSLFLLSGYIGLSLLDLMAMNRICKHITAINQGDYTPHTEDKYSSAYCITQKLNNISAGIQSAVDRQVQSERMKIDLVTNVSHDLKTPLTSIISYIDLLSSEALSPEARDYVTIIENKSQRLKTMVEDLFDLAKATSHTDIDMEKIDAVILANQVLADLSDKIDSSGKQVKTDIQAVSAPVMAEGKKMYRVFQNLIDNALKYSLDGTRIYFTLKNEAGYCIVNIKNIASYEMNFAPDEIIERFTRGDESRSTEGNGLGLSIAKSFTEACGGTFSVAIDGDVFITEVRLPILPVNITKE